MAAIARRSGRRSKTNLTAAAVALAMAPAANAAPAIRTSAANPVPACVTPKRLMAFLGERNSNLDAHFRNIASWYKYYGDAWHVRWDYAFFQMAIETNFLTFRRGNGEPGDVRKSQNNFAGIGATGGGAHGEQFADVQTGVQAQIQHLVAYSGERLAEPVAKRTRDMQDDIVDTSHRLGRPVTFGDLARRWAVDRAYGKSIDYVAGLFEKEFCTHDAAPRAADITPPTPRAARHIQESVARRNGVNAARLRPAPADAPGSTHVAAASAPSHGAESDAAKDAGGAPKLPVFKIAPAADEPSRLGGPLPKAPLATAATDAAKTSNTPCSVLSASYGGTKTLLVRSSAQGETRYTALTVLDGFESSMFGTYAEAKAPGAEIIGEYPNSDAALAAARLKCPNG